MDKNTQLTKYETRLEKKKEEIKNLSKKIESIKKEIEQDKLNELVGKLRNKPEVLKHLLDANLIGNSEYELLLKKN